MTMGINFRTHIVERTDFHKFVSNLNTYVSVIQSCYPPLPHIRVVKTKINTFLSIKKASVGPWDNLRSYCGFVPFLSVFTHVHS